MKKKKSVAYTYKRILFSLEKEGNSDTHYYLYEPCSSLHLKLNITTKEKPKASEHQPGGRRRTGEGQENLLSALPPPRLLVHRLLPRPICLSRAEQSRESLACSTSASGSREDGEEGRR